MAVVSWASAADWDRFTPELVNTATGGQVLALGATAGEATVDGGALGDGNDRRVYRYFGQKATDLEARLDFRLIPGGNPTPQIGLMFFRKTGLPLTVWTNIVFEANALLLLGAWNYNGTTLVNTNQQSWQHNLRDGGVQQLAGDPNRVRSLRVRVDDVGTRLRIKQWMRDEAEPGWQYDGPMPTVVGTGPGEVGLILAHTGANRGDIRIDSLTIATQDDYTSLAEMKLWMGGHAEDAEQPSALDGLIQAAITGTSRWLERKCKRHFYQRVETRYFAADDAYNLALGHWNDLVDLQSLTTDEDGDGVYEGVWATSEFELRPRNAPTMPEERPYRSVRAIGRRFPINATQGGRIERLALLGTWGWPSYPSGIVTGTKIQVARIVKRKEAPEGIMGLNQFGVLRVANKPDPDVMQAIGPYRLRSLG